MVDMWHSQRVFEGAKDFNSDLSRWDVSRFQHLLSFFELTALDCDLTDWDVSNVKDMERTFAETSRFNGDITNWNTTKASMFQEMFSSSSAFNQDISKWDVSGATDMSGMFMQAIAFNQDISSWVISNVDNFLGMFHDVNPAMDPCTKMAIKREWTRRAKVPPSSTDFSFSGSSTSGVDSAGMMLWPRLGRCRCRQWEKLNSRTSVCEPALWLHFDPCFYPNATAEDYNALSYSDIMNLTMNAETRGMYAQYFAKQPHAEQFAIRLGASASTVQCTHLPGFGSIMNNLLQYGLSKQEQIIVGLLKKTTTRQDLDLTITHNVKDVSVRVMQVSGDAQGFSLKFYAGKTCGEEMKFDVRDGKDKTTEYMSLGFTMKTGSMSMADITAETLEAMRNKTATPLTCRSSGGLKPALPPLYATMPETLPHATEPYFTLSRIDPNALTAPTPPSIRCPPVINVVSDQPRFFFGVLPDNAAEQGNHSLTLAESIAPVPNHTLAFGTTYTPGSRNRSVVHATDSLNVSKMEMEINDNQITSHADGRFSLPSDYQGNVTFIATNLLGMAAKCSSVARTFTASDTWRHLKAKTELKLENGAYYVNYAYKIEGPEATSKLSKAQLFSNPYLHEAASDIRFELTLVPRVDDLVSIDSVTGLVVVTPNSGHLNNSDPNRTFTAKMRGVDSAGHKALVNEWVFTIRERGEFKVDSFARIANLTEDEATASTGALKTISNVSVASRKPLETGAPFTFAPITEVTYTLDEYANASVTYTIVGNATEGEFFIRPSTGEVYGLVRREAVYHFQSRARNEFGDTALVEDVFLTFRHADTALAANGPNLVGCQNGGDAVDDTPFDNSFSCDCANTQYYGDNCEDKIQTAAILGSVIGVLLVMTFAGIAIVKHRKHVKRNAPATFEKQLQYLKDAGLIDSESTDAHGDDGDTLDALDKVKRKTAHIPRELRRSWLTMIKRVGEGQFGEVWKGLLHDQSLGVPEYMVAVKASKVDAKDIAQSAQAEADLLQEAFLMAQVRYSSLVPTRAADNKFRHPL